MTEQPAPYPLQFSIDYPESSRRLTVFFRLLLAIPILIVLALVGGSVVTDEVQLEGAGLRSALCSSDAGTYQWPAALATGGLLWLPPMLMIVFRRKYPRWWFDWNLELTRFGTRVEAYVLLLRDDYPSTDEAQGVHLDIPYPDAQGELNRFLPLVKWILAIPHYIALAIVWTLAILVTIIAWFVILIVGRYPRELFLFVEGTLRWSLRVAAYAFLLTTDRYPPFRFGA